MTPYQKLFLVGAAGAFAVEIVRWYLLVSSILHRQYSKNPSPIPTPTIPGYMWLAFGGLTIAMAGLGGVLAILYKPQMLLGAFHVGASAPLILLQFARKAPRR